MRGGIKEKKIIRKKLKTKQITITRMWIGLEQKK